MDYGEIEIEVFFSEGGMWKETGLPKGWTKAEIEYE
jgi:hypothetical protein